METKEFDEDELLKNRKRKRASKWIWQKNKKDRATRKDLWKKKKEICGKDVKICTRCKRRKVIGHHYLCNLCWNNKNKDWIKKNGIIQK